MTEVAIWLLVIVAGIAALGLIETARGSKFAETTTWSEVRTVALGAAFIFITLIAATLAVTWAVVIFFAEIWLPFLIAIGVLVGGAVFLTLWFRQRSFFYASALALVVALVLLVF
jgi:hypothetical protein